MTHTTPADRLNLAELPDDMRAAKRWLVWRAEPNPGDKHKARKVPFYVSGRRRSHTLDGPADLAELASLEDALTALDSGPWTGLGFALGPDGSGLYWQGIDIDDPDLAIALRDSLPGYLERSPSGRGLHAIGRGREFATLGANGSGIEAYSHARYFTVTADSLGGALEDLADFVETKLAPRHRKTPSRNTDTTTAQVPAALLHDLRSALTAIPADDRDTWQRMGHALVGLGNPGRSLWFEWSQTSEKYDASDAARVWASFRPHTIDHRAVFKEATSHGWANPASRRRQSPPAAPSAVEEHPIDRNEPWNTSPQKEYFPNDVHRHSHVHNIAAAVATIEAAIGACRENPGTLATDEFRAAGRLLRQDAPEEWLRLRVKIRETRPNGVRMEDIDAGTQPAREAPDETSTADELVDLVTRRSDLFHASDGTCYAALRETPRRVFRLDTSAFAEWLSFAFFKETATPDRPGRAASDTAIRTARVVLSGIARHDGEEREVFLRCARKDSTYYIDIGDEAWRAIEINADGWRIIDDPPVMFYRSSTCRPLPTPAPTGDLARLWSFANVPESDRPLVTAWMLENLRPETPFPVLELIGPQGSAKSTTQAKLRSVIDPNAVDLRAAPKSVEDLFVSAGVNWMTSINNVSHLTANLQDALCNLATGGGFAGRTLYTNADETLIEAKRPVIINGIVPLVTAQDLTDRVIHCELPEIQAYRSETSISEQFTDAAPAILTGLLDTFVRALRALPKVRIERPPRMADFAALGEAMMQSSGHPPGAFVALYNENRRSSTARSLEASPVAVAIRELVDVSQHGSVPAHDGTMKLLLERLSAFRGSTDAWPKNPRGLGDALRRQMPALAQLGIKVEISKPGRDGVKVLICRSAMSEREHVNIRECRSETIPSGGDKHMETIL